MRESFQSNPNKDFLRSSFDKLILREWRERIGRPLSYLGLPGPEMLDVIEWQEYLGFFTTIERSENEQHLLFLRANVRDVEHRLHSLYGDFDKILITGRDSYNHTPRWPYELVNLDFYGGVLYSDLSRPKALQKLIENQDAFATSFLLIITSDLRDADRAGEKKAFFEDLARRLSRDYRREAEVREFIAWYQAPSTPDAARQSLFVNIFLRDHGEAAHFRVTCRSPIVYFGTGGSKMIHFVTQFDHQAHSYRAVSDQSLLDVLNLGFRELREESLLEPVAFPRLAI